MRDHGEIPFTKEILNRSFKLQIGVFIIYETGLLMFLPLLYTCFNNFN